MNATTPVERIKALLEGNGYRSLKMPLSIAGFEFDVPAALVGTGKKSDLVLVTDTVFEPGERIRQKVESIAGALDAVESKRPMTVVIAGPRPSTPVLEGISKVCRVLPVGTVIDDSPDLSLLDWLAVLLPLHVPPPTADLANPVEALANEISSNAEPATRDLLAAANEGSAAVERTLHELVAAPLTHLDISQ